MADQHDRELTDAFRVLRIELRAADDRIAAAAGIHPRDLDVLDVIDREGACTPGHLSDRTGIRAATLTGVLARLESDGWIAREVNPSDARSSRVSSTERFEEVRRLFGQAGGPVRRVFDEVSPGDRAAVLWYLQTLAAAFRDMGSGTPAPKVDHLRERSTAPTAGSDNERTR